MQWLGSRASGSSIERPMIFVKITDFLGRERAIVDLDLINVALPGILALPVDAQLDLVPGCIEISQAVVICTGILGVVRTVKHVIAANKSV